MTHDGRAVANFVLDHAETLGLRITNLSLQKLVYFCHVWSLIDLGQPLIKQSFEAWEYGPVLQYLYREFKVFGSTPIEVRALRLNPFNGQSEVVPYSFDQRTLSLLRGVVEFYGRLNAGMLVDLTHGSGGPWDKVWRQGGNIKPGMRIDNRDIALFYSQIPKPVTLQ